MGQCLLHSDNEFNIDMDYCLKQMQQEEQYKPIVNYLSQIKKNMGSNLSSHSLIEAVINLGLNKIPNDQSIFMIYDSLHVLVTKMCRRSNIGINNNEISDCIFRKTKWAKPHPVQTQNAFSQIINEYSPILKFDQLKKNFLQENISRNKVVHQFTAQLGKEETKVQNQFYFQIRFIQDFHFQSLLQPNETTFLADLLQGVNFALNQPKFQFQFPNQIEERESIFYLEFVKASSKKYLGYLKVLIKQFIEKLKMLDERLNIPFQNLNSSLLELKAIDVMNIDYYQSYLNYKQEVEIKHCPCQSAIQKTFFHLHRQNLILKGIEIWNSIYQTYTNQLFKVDCIKYIVALTTHSIYTFYGYLFINQGIDKQLLHIICQGISEVLIFPKIIQTQFYTPTQTFNYLCGIASCKHETNCRAEIQKEKDNSWRLNQYNKQFNDIQSIDEILKQFEFTNTYLIFSYQLSEQKNNYDQLQKYLKFRKNPEDQSNSDCLQI